MPLADPNNCWPFTLQRFADVLASSATFRTLVGAVDADGATAKIFGKRLTYARSGRRYTVAELQTLSAYAQVYGDPNQPYGKQPGRGLQYYPFGTTNITLSRIVTDLAAERPADSTGLTDAHDRDWQNIIGTIIDETLAAFIEQGPTIGRVQITLDDETPAVLQGQQGCWQGVEISFPWQEEG